MVTLCSLDELLGVFFKILPHAIEVICDPKGAHVMLRIVEKLVRMIPNGSMMHVVERSENDNSFMIHLKSGYNHLSFHSIVNAQMLAIWIPFLGHYMSNVCRGRYSQPMPWLCCIIVAQNTYCEGDESGKAEVAFEHLCRLFYNNYTWCINIANSLLGKWRMLHDISSCDLCFCHRKQIEQRCVSNGQTTRLKKDAVHFQIFTTWSNHNDWFYINETCTVAAQ